MVGVLGGATIAPPTSLIKAWEQETPCGKFTTRGFGKSLITPVPQAAQMAGLEKVLCVVEEMDDDTAFMELVLANNQGELSYRERAHHTFSSVRRTQGKAGGKAEDGTFDSLEAYAKDQNISLTTASEEYKVGMINAELLRTCEEVYDRVNQHESETGKSLGRHQLSISKAPQQYWQQLTELLIENKWSVRDTEAIVDAVNKMVGLQCPDWLTEIVKFDRAVITAIKGDDRIYGTMRSCINTALECHESLETITVLAPILGIALSCFRGCNGYTPPGWYPESSYTCARFQPLL